MEMQPIDPNKPLNGAITTSEWNALLSAATSVHLIVAPAIVEKLMEQFRRQSQMTTEDVERAT